MKITRTAFGLGATKIQITNSKGISISFTNLGARVVDWRVGGQNIVLGFDCAEDYLEKDPYRGATVGRTAGRIKNGLVEINGQEIQLLQNESAQSLHGGGPETFEKKLWMFDIEENESSATVHFYLTSNHGENGYPGKLSVIVSHTFDEESKWTIDYKAVSDADTIFNPTNHVYFNLNADHGETIENHRLQVAASRVVALEEETKVASGEALELEGTDFDFRSEKLLSQALASQMKQIKMLGGIDHPFLLDEVDVAKEQACLSLGNLSLSVMTDQPAIVIFTANFGKDEGEHFLPHGGIAFECQVPPGTETMPELGNILLKSGEEYTAKTIYKLEIGE